MIGFDDYTFRSNYLTGSPTSRAGAALAQGQGPGMTLIAEPLFARAA